MDVEVAMAMVLMTMVTILAMVLRMAHGDNFTPGHQVAGQTQAQL